MQLKTLIDGIPVRQVIGTLDRPVESIAYDSRRAQRNGLFVALRGGKGDGHQFIAQAIEKGASVIVAEREDKYPRATCLVVENSRTALADLSRAFYGRPGDRLKLAAVTGTNGKTTTTFLPEARPVPSTRNVPAVPPEHSRTGRRLKEPALS